MLVKRLILYLIFFCVPSLVGFSQNEDQGIFNYQDYDFEEGTIRLSGYWEFYHEQLLTPRNFKNKVPTYLKVPGSWRVGTDYPVLGYGTYRCIAVLPATQNDLLLFFSVINSSANIWVNGEKMEQIGKVSDDPAAYQAQLKAVNIALPAYVDTVEIVVQVANYSYFSAGIVSHPRIGKANNLIQNKNRTNGIENFFAGGLIAMFIYQIILYFLYNRGRPNLWLALICLGVALRSMILHGGSFLLPNLFPFIPFEIWKKIEFGSVYLIIALFPLYIHHLFDLTSKSKLVSFFVILGLVLGVSVIFTPQYIYGQLLDICHLGLVLSFIYAIYTVSHAWKKGNPDAKIIFFGVLASFPFILLEILKNSFYIDIYIQFEYLVELGVLVFLLFQVYILARHYANSYKTLEVVNRELETTVTERTQELVESNSIKERLLSVISHDVKSPLNSLQGLISFYNSKSLTKKEFDHYFKQIEGDLNKTAGLVDNILFWTANQRKGGKILIEKVNLQQLVDENINHLHALARNKTLTITHNLPKDFSIETDRGILNITLRNLLANAIKFSNVGDSIEIELKDDANAIALSVIDHGTGMNEEQIASISIGDRNDSTDGTKAEKGTGLGLSLCHEFLEKIGGTLTIASEVGAGSTFKINLPKK